jgi:hypothetical protein
MVRRRWVIGQLALVGVLALLAFPGEGSALRPVFLISLTPTGPSPAVMSVSAGFDPVWFRNTDTVIHTVAFANGSCSIQVAPGGGGQCTSSFMSYVGEYPYTVDGVSQGQLDIEAVGRSVSLEARRHSISRGLRLTLHGRLREENGNWSPPNAGIPQPVTVLARHNRYQPFRRIAVVIARLHGPTKGAPFGELLWQVRVRPQRHMIYIAEANSQPKGGQIWQRAWSKPFKVLVSH